jgi:hypothetical protein
MMIGEEVVAATPRQSGRNAKPCHGSWRKYIIIIVNGERMPLKVVVFEASFITNISPAEAELLTYPGQN